MACCLGRPFAGEQTPSAFCAPDWRRVGKILPIHVQSAQPSQLHAACAAALWVCIKQTGEAVCNGSMYVRFSGQPLPESAWLAMPLFGRVALLGAIGGILRRNWAPHPVPNLCGQFIVFSVDSRSELLVECLLRSAAGRLHAFPPTAAPVRRRNNDRQHRSGQTRPETLRAHG